MLDDLSLLECLGKLETNTMEGAVNILRCFREHGIIFYWSDRWGRLIARLKNGRRGSMKSLMKDITTTLNISSKADWERIKRKYEL